MSKTVTFEAWGVYDDSGGLCMDRGVPAIYPTRDAAWIRARNSGVMNAREILVRVTVETIEEDAAK